MNNKSTWGALLSAVGTSFLASLCCLGPLLIVSLGAGGAWASYTTFFEPYRPYMMGLVGILLCYSFYKLYIKPPTCGIGGACISPKMLLIQRALFWIITAISIAFLTFPWYSEFILRMI